MTPKTKKYLIVPIVIAGFIAGYGIADKFFNKVMPPPEQAQMMTYDLLQALGAQPNYFRETPSGNYLAGQFAQRQKDWDSAYKFIKKAKKNSDDNIDIKRHLMVLAMGQGDLDQAVELAKEISVEEEDHLLSTLFLAIDNFKDEEYSNAIATLSDLKQEGPATFLVPVLKLWAAAGMGDIKSVDLPRSSFYAHHALLIHQFLSPSPALLEYALNSYQADDIDLRDVVKFADLLVLADKKDIALNFYKAIDAGGFANQETKDQIYALENNR